MDTIKIRALSPREQVPKEKIDDLQSDFHNEMNQPLQYTFLIPSKILQREQNLTLFPFKNESPSKQQKRNLEFHEDYSESSKIE